MDGVIKPYDLEVEHLPISDRSIKALEMYIDLYKHCVENDRAEDARKILDQAILRLSGPMIIAKGREG